MEHSVDLCVICNKLGLDTYYRRVASDHSVDCLNYWLGTRAHYDLFPVRCQALAPLMLNQHGPRHV